MHIQLCTKLNFFFFQMRGQRKKSDKVIVIQNVFDFKDFDRNAALILECSSKLREHCSKFGSVTKVCVYDKNPDGICQVFFKSPEEADLAISMLDGRLFSKACGAMKCNTWDGKTKYKITESAEEEKERLANWEKFLKAEDDEGDKKVKTTTTTTTETPPTTTTETPPTTTTTATETPTTTETPPPKTGSETTTSETPPATTASETPSATTASETPTAIPPPTTETESS